MNLKDSKTLRFQFVTLLELFTWKIYGTPMSFFGNCLNQPGIGRWGLVNMQVLVQNVHLIMVVDRHSVPACTCIRWGVQGNVRP